MTTNINTAFTTFLSDTVNLDPNDSAKAKQDRVNLETRINQIETNSSSFPKLLSEHNIHFGSFSRRTKKRPLDDVDMMFCLNAQGATYNEFAGNEGIDIYVNDTNSNLYRFTNDDNKTLNSIKVLNNFKIELGNIYEYRSSEINTRQEAVRLQLTTRDWSFDIVPCFYTDVDNYLIPDGQGKWKKTDPRIDKDRTTTINQANSGNVLNVIRIIKFWNSRPTMPTIPSYLLEVMILNYYQWRTSASSYVDLEIPGLLAHIRDKIYSVVTDPKGFQGNLNNLTLDQKSKIYSRAHEDYNKSIEARVAENTDIEECFRKWRQVFGTTFPAYS
ncbi:nucleotidyltransferase [Pseudomonas kuykendallii]|uniref:Nucleotidyltransferase n=1 Tax=Pseudomonas kuykendallii TaxID=1007099 RepID=A0A1H2Z3V5_9PSED|nr:nucleotidyltransferase [Pseudomonas kuykendallii]MCQ4269408.1 nucleotidyltransferase [Pseudomonas kuykendallii]SDX12112.1 hypothetical protein SAMN05216287_2158 [Pseudomonas kuykendallii]